MRLLARFLALAIPVVPLVAAAPCRAQEERPPTGQLLVVTEPAGARVAVDGAPVGVAPVSVPDLVPGAHLVAAVAADGARAERVVEVESGRSTLVQLALAPAEATPAESRPPAEPVAAAPMPVETSAPAVAPGAPAELGAIDLTAPAEQGPSEHVEDEPIDATGFPGLLGLTIGARIDVPVYVVTPIQVPTCGPAGCRGSSSSTIATGRLSIELGLDPAFAIVTAIDLGSGAFGGGVAANLPGYLPLVRDFAIALQPHLQGLVYYHPGGGILLSAETTLRLGIAPIPHLVVAAEVGAVVVGAISFGGTSTVVEGAYVGPIFGGGVEWAFY